MPSWFARNFLMKMAIWARKHISCHEKPKLNDNIFGWVVIDFVGSENIIQHNLKGLLPIVS